MNENFDRAFVDLLGNEGGYVNDPRDPGGETNWGITVGTARAHGYMGKMKELTVEMAKAVYLRSYWLPEFEQLPYDVSFQLFDTAVNSGPSQAAILLQRAVGVKTDGKIGPMTLAAAKEYSPDALIMLFDAERLDFMAGLSGWLSFGRGWARRIANNLRKGALQ